MAKKKKSKNTNTIASNKRARHDYFIDNNIEAGLALEGWEVKSLREGMGQLVDSYVIFKNEEAWLVGAHISPLLSASTHIEPDPTRPRKLLLHKKELARLFAGVQREGHTCLALSLYWKQGKVKCEIALGKGKHLHDKRATEKERDWNMEKQRVLRKS